MVSILIFLFIPILVKELHPNKKEPNPKIESGSLLIYFVRILFGLINSFYMDAVFCSINPYNIKLLRRQARNINLVKLV